MAKGDLDWPNEYHAGDARFNSVFMGDPTGLLGFGPSLVDFRSGEILVSNVLLGLSTFVRATSNAVDDVLDKCVSVPWDLISTYDLNSNCQGRCLSLMTTPLSTPTGVSLSRFEPVGARTVCCPQMTRG